MKQYDPTDPFARGEIENRVKLGSELLDEHYHRWEDAIVLTDLDLEDAHSCILGQIGGHPEFSGNRDFHMMLPIIFPNTEPEAMDQAVMLHGFDIIGQSGHWLAEYEALNEAWTSAIKERQDRQ